MEFLGKTGAVMSLFFRREVGLAFVGMVAILLVFSENKQYYQL